MKKDMINYDTAVHLMRMNSFSVKTSHKICIYSILNILYAYAYCVGKNLFKVSCSAEKQFFSKFPNELYVPSSLIPKTQIIFGKKTFI